MRFSRTAADLLLLSVALIWGGTFVIVRDTVRILPPLFLIGGRFLLALIALLVIFPRNHQHWRENSGPGLILAGILLGGFVLQTYGLRYTSASASGFITGLNVVLVALIAAATHGRRLPARTLFSVILATLGLFALSWQSGGWHFGLGDLLTLGCAVFFALHIVATGYLAPGRDPVVLTALQFAGVAFGSLVMHFMTGGGLVVPRGPGWLALGYLGLAATGFAFLIQTTAQRHTPPVDTAIILSTEPLFAAAIAVLLGGEQMTAPLALGGLAIFTATLLAVLAPANGEKRRRGDKGTRGLGDGETGSVSESGPGSTR